MKVRSWALLICLLAVAATCTYPVFAQANNAGQNGREAEPLVNVQFKDVPVQEAIRVLFEGKLNYVLEQGVQGIVNVKLRDVPFTDALQAVLKAANMTVRKENGIYMIGPQKELTMEQAPQDLYQEPEVEIEREKLPEKIMIGYADVNVIADVFGVTAVGSPYGSGSNGGGMGGGMGGMMGGMGGGMGGMMGGGMGGMGGMMGGGMGGMGGGMGGMGGGMGGMGGGMGGMGGGMGGFGGGSPRW